jgi:ABC-type lipoprotein export system ATPase subunit
MNNDMNNSMVDKGFRVEGLQLRPSGPVWTFAVSPGEAIWIKEARDSEARWLDWLTGIEAPPIGQVCWDGVEWRERSPDEASEERGRLGCVFAAGGLVINLDMDENVRLPSLMHRREDAEEAIEKWARFFRCWPLPQARASTLPERMRRRILWARAFSGNPAALILERPMLDMLDEGRKLFLDAVRQVRAAGCVVVWLDEALRAETTAALEPLVCVTPEAD